jgi:DNA-binding beta-propeller fold protein YncE
MDHLAIDTAGQRLFVAAEDNGTLRVIDLKTGKLERTIKGFNTPHSILFLPAQNELYITDGSKAVQVLDATSLQTKTTIPTTPVASGEGKIYQYEQIDPDHYKVLEPIQSAPGAKTTVLYPDCSRLFVAVSPGEGKPELKCSRTGQLASPSPFFRPRFNRAAIYI